VTTVETKLANALQLATKWNAIILIDEADVFLEERRTNDIQRNALIASQICKPSKLFAIV
jgi:hypothetical protein